MSDFHHPGMTRNEKARAIEYIHFVVLHEMEDVTREELTALLRDTELIENIVALGVCVSRKQVKTQIEAVLSLRALKNDAPVD